MRRILMLLLAGMNVMGLGAFEWPVEQRSLVSTFGENRWDSFLPGVDIGGGVQDIHPAEAGELVYYVDGSEGMGAIPSGLGVLAVIEHERGLRTLYGHMEAGSLVKDIVSVDTGDVIGRTGSSGMSEGLYLHFQVIDREMNQMVNPLLLLPPLKDTTKPILEALYLRKNRGMEVLAERAIMSPGLYELLLSVHDPSDTRRYYQPMTPYKIQVFLNGEQHSSVSFEALRYHDGKVFLVQSNNALFEDIYTGDGLLKMGTLQLSTGDTILEIIVEDFSRNRITKEFRIKVSG